MPSSLTLVNIPPQVGRNPPTVVWHTLHLVWKWEALFSMLGIEVLCIAASSVCALSAQKFYLCQVTPIYNWHASSSLCYVIIQGVNVFCHECCWFGSAPYFSALCSPGYVEVACCEVKPKTHNLCACIAWFYCQLWPQCSHCTCKNGPSATVDHPGYWQSLIKIDLNASSQVCLLATMLTRQEHAGLTICAIMRAESS